MVINSEIKQLSKYHCLITRPQHQAQELNTKLLQAGARTTLFPTINIELFSDEESRQQLKNQMLISDLIIFTSQNAVQYVAENSLIDLVATKHVATVGASTARALHRLGINHVVYPPVKMNSEGLLHELELFLVKNERILIITGEDGRSYLSNELNKIGKCVVVFAIYRRTLPQIDKVYWKEYFSNADVNLVICTSMGSLLNLIELIKTLDLPLVQEKLLKCELLVIKKEMLVQAQALAWKGKILVANDPTANAIIKCLELNHDKD